MAASFPSVGEAPEFAFRLEVPWAAVAPVLAAAIVVSLLAALFTVRRATDHPTAENADA